MAIVKCINSECFAEISDRAAVCPRCGALKPGDVDYHRNVAMEKRADEERVEARATRIKALLEKADPRSRNDFESKETIACPECRAEMPLGVALKGACAGCGHPLAVPCKVVPGCQEPANYVGEVDFRWVPYCRQHNTTCHGCGSLVPDRRQVESEIVWHQKFGSDTRSEYFHLNKALCEELRDVERQLRTIREATGQALAQRKRDEKRRALAKEWSAWAAAESKEQEATRAARREAGECTRCGNRLSWLRHSLLASELCSECAHLPTETNCASCKTPVPLDCPKLNDPVRAICEKCFVRLRE